MEIELFEKQFLGNSVQDWTVAGSIFIGLFVLFWLARMLLVSQLRIRAPKTANPWDDVFLLLLEKTHSLFPLLISLHVASQWLHLSPKTAKAGDLLFFLVLFLQVGGWATRAMVFLGNGYAEKSLAKDAGRATTVRALMVFGKMLIWGTVLLLLLDNWGVKIAPFVAGLGIGGVAIALAVQNILGDLFASLSIVLDKPFVIGDFIIVGNEMGTVERVGLKTTRLRSLSGEQLIFSNSDLLQSRVRNYKRMQDRRAQLNFGVTYETAPEKLDRIRKIVQEIISSIDGLRFERCHLNQLSASSLDFETIYWVNSADYQYYIERHHAATVKLIAAFGREGIGFAYPTTTVHMASQENKA